MFSICKIKNPRRSSRILSYLKYSLYSQENRILYWIQSGHLDPQQTHLQKRIFCIFLLYSWIEGPILDHFRLPDRDVLRPVPSSSVSSMHVVRTADKWLFMMSNSTLSAISEPVWMPSTFANCSKKKFLSQSRIWWTSVRPFWSQKPGTTLEIILSP